MIGVIPKPDQMAAVEEFFELFKTPWEFYKDGHSYDAVLVTADEIPEVSARLLLVYGSETKNTDEPSGIAPRTPEHGGALRYGGSLLPIYGKLLTFKDGCTPVKRKV